jgi:acetyl esterase/lipase
MSTPTASSPMADGTSAGALLEPMTQSFIDALTAAGGPPLYTLSPAAARDVLADAQAQPVAKLNAVIEDTTFPVGPTGSVRIRIIRPPDTGGVLPVVMHFHGGGWILGDKDTHDRMAREIAVGANAALVFVDYDRSPQAQYPTAIEQAYAATQYVADHGSELNLDSSRLAVLGDSVGGNMAAAVTPLNASVAQPSDLPDALVIVNENDVLRDEGEAYARKLSQAGVRVASVRYNGTIHDFVLLNALATTPGVCGAVAEINAALEGALHPTDQDKAQEEAISVRASISQSRSGAPAA